MLLFPRWGAEATRGDKGGRLETDPPLLGLSQRHASGAASTGDWH